MVLVCSKLPPTSHAGGWGGGALCRTGLSGSTHPSGDPLARRRFIGWTPQLGAGCRR